MAHGRVIVVLGSQGGLNSVTDLCRGINQSSQNPASGLTSGGGYPKGRATDSEIYSLLTQLIHLSKSLCKEDISIDWTSFGSNSGLDVKNLISTMDGDLADVITTVRFDDLADQECDAVIFAPLDCMQPRQVEQLARLSMVLPRSKHIALSATPKWGHPQLMALRETWTWVDPKTPSKMLALCDDIIRMNGGLTRKDIAKLDLPEIAKPTTMASQGPTIVTRSVAFRRILDLVDAVADTDSTILVSGDSGTGKELIAERIHAKSHRVNRPLVAVNCGAIPAELLESELFGHMKGAFTGAISNREGRFQAAEGGTLFLDEIGEMTPSLQVKLLRVLQTRKYEPVGATKSRNADVRIIAATNRDLEAEVKAGRFREDLFYRLNVIPVHVLPLRERPEDVQLLVEYFTKKFNQEKGRRVTGITRASLRALVAYAWPGNVRELENLVERMVILKSSGMIDVLDFPEKYRRLSLSEIEYEDLLNASKNGVAGSSLGTIGGVSPGNSSQTMLQIDETTDFKEVEEEIMIKSIPGTFTKGRVEQSSSNIQENGIDASQEMSGSMNLGGDTLSVEQAIRLLQDRMGFPNEGLDFNAIVDQFENILILQALERTGWNRNRAAQLLRLNRTTLVEKLKKKQLLPPPRFANSFLEGNA